MTSTTSPGDHVDVLENHEAFEEVDGRFQFTGTLVVYRANNDIYHAVSKARYRSSSEIRAGHLTKVLLIPVSAYRPSFPSNFTRVPDPLLPSCHIKKPPLFDYDRIRQGPHPNRIMESILREVGVCEILKRHPHPNIATYLGCQVSDSRITGICFAKYHSTLMQTVNPGNHMKRKLRAARLLHQQREDYSRVLEGVERGIQHLHSLGLVHNDINPSNIMLHNDTAIIIDFGSCRGEGESVEGVGRTYEWYDEAVHESVPENDFHALEEIRIWLGDGSEEFRFHE